MTQQSAGRDPVNVSPATEAGQQVLNRVMYLYDEVRSPDSDDVKYVAKALAAIEQEAAAIDGERLARALHEMGVGCPFDLHWRPERHEVDWHDVQARAAAAEYARLATPPTDPEPEPFYDSDGVPIPDLVFNEPCGCVADQFQTLITCSEHTDPAP